MTRRTILLAVVAALVSAVAITFHFGPVGIRPGDELLLASVITTNSPEWFVVAKRNDNLVEAYSVELYRVDSEGIASSFYLAHEDSYWWACSLNPSAATGDLEIRAGGEIVARYIRRLDAVWLEDQKRWSTAYRTKGWLVREKLRHVRGYRRGDSGSADAQQEKECR